MDKDSAGLDVKVKHEWPTEVSIDQGRDRLQGVDQMSQSSYSASINLAQKVAVLKEEDDTTEVTPPDSGFAVVDVNRVQPPEPSRSPEVDPLQLSSPPIKEEPPFGLRETLLIQSPELLIQPESRGLPGDTAITAKIFNNRQKRNEVLLSKKKSERAKKVPAHFEDYVTEKESNMYYVKSSIEKARVMATKKEMTKNRLVGLHVVNKDVINLSPFAASSQENDSTETVTSQLLSSSFPVLGNNYGLDVNESESLFTSTQTPQSSPGQEPDDTQGDDDDNGGTRFPESKEKIAEDRARYRDMWSKETIKNEQLQEEIVSLKKRNARELSDLCPMCKAIDKKQLIKVLGLDCNNDTMNGGAKEASLFLPQEQGGPEVELCPGSKVTISKSRRAVVLMKSEGCPKKIIRNTLLEFYPKDKLGSMTALGRNNTDCIPKEILHGIFEFAYHKMKKLDNNGEQLQPLKYSEFITVVNQKCSNERKWLKIKNNLKQGIARKNTTSSKKLKTRKLLQNTAGCSQSSAASVSLVPMEKQLPQRYRHLSNSGNFSIDEAFAQKY